MSKLDPIMQHQQSNRSVNRRMIMIFLFVSALFFGSMYISFHQLKVNDMTVNIFNVLGIVLLPLLYYMLIVKPKNGKAGFTYIIFIASIACTYWITPVEQKEFLKTLLRWLIPLLEVVIVLYIAIRLYFIIKRYKLARNNNEAQPMDSLHEALVPLLGKGALLEIVMTEIKVMYYSIGVLFRKPSLPQDSYYTYHRHSQIKPIVIVFIIIITLEAVGLHFLLSMWNDIIAWIALVLNAYAILYLIALSNSFRYLPNLLHNDRLHIRLGIQCDISIPLHSIQSIDKAKEIGLGEKQPKDLYIAHLRFDTPQFHIQLKEPINVKGSYGISKTISAIVLRVDEPQSFLDHLKHRMNNHDDHSIR